ncbi:uncharacterized protein LOC144655110 [Oculina patagonica]
MKNMDEITKAIYIGITVANFLLNTCRVLKAIEFCKECLIILKNHVVTKEGKAIEIYKRVYLTMFKAYNLINDYTSAIKYGKKLLVIYQKRGERAIESKLSLQLAGLYQIQSKYVEAKELCEKALAISKEIGCRDGQASSYSYLGTVSLSQGEYTKAKEYIQKELAIKIEIGDKNRLATVVY